MIKRILLIGWYGRVVVGVFFFFFFLQLPVFYRIWVLSLFQKDRPSYHLRGQAGVLVSCDNSG